MSLNDYEDVLKSFILDDDKLVTYKWLSKELEIHVNLAKDILKQYWDKYKSKEKILATLLLVGKLKDGSFRVVVAKESELDSVKQTFVKIDCEHLYSIQKSLPDIELLALVGEGDLRYSAIKCNEEYVRNDDEIESLRYVGNVRKEENKVITNPATTNKVIEKPVPKKIELSATEKISKKQSDKKTEAKEKEKAKEKPEEKEKADTEITITKEKKKSPPNKSNNKTSKKPIQSKQSGFNNLFGRVQTKPQTESSKPDDSPKDKQDNSSGSTEKYEKPRSTETNKKLSKEEEKLNKSRDQGNGKKETQEKENRHSQAEEKSKKIAKTEEKIEKSKSKAKSESRGKKRNRSQEKNTLSKRKRIVVLESSEDESGKSVEEEEEEPMEVEEVHPKVIARRSPSPPAEKRENGKRMVRKTIDKTFKDEEGFLVTKRVHVYEAASDNEETEVKEKESQKPKPVEVQAKKKQTTLMNFFKKS